MQYRYRSIHHGPHPVGQRNGFLLRKIHPDGGGAPAAQITPGWSARSIVPQVSNVVRPGSLTYIYTSFLTSGIPIFIDVP